MRLFKIFVVLVFVFTTSKSFAQFFAGANAYAGVNAPAGTWGGAQACPYPVGGGGGSGEGTTAIERLAAQVQSMRDAIEEIEEEQDEIRTGDHDRFDSDSVQLHQEVREGILLAAANRGLPCAANSDGATWAETAPPETLAMFEKLQQDPGQFCNGIVFDEKKVCDSPNAFAGKRDSSRCRSMISTYAALELRKKKMKKNFDRLDKRLWDMEQEREDRRVDALVAGKPLPPEGGCMTGDCYGAPEPQAPGWRAIGVAAGMDLLNAAAWYYGTRYVSKNNAKLGWATPPMALGLPIPYATGSLMAGYFGGGMGSGFAGCSPASGFGNFGPNGMYGNPWGNMSPYGACGGAFASPCMGGGGGWGPTMGGMFPGFGVGGQIGIGGWPMGGMMGGWPMGGMFPGAWPGGYGVAGGAGGGWGPMMGGFPMGGMMGGMMGSPFGMNPYFGGGAGGGWGPMMGGFPMGGMMGGFPMGGMGGMMGMPGMMPGMGMPGMGMGMEYQMQLMQMQMAAQQRAFQNQQVVSQQLQGLQMEYMQIQQRYQYLMSQFMMGGTGYLTGGGYLGGSIGLPGYGGGGGGIGSGPVPYPGTGGGTIGGPTGPAPAR